MTFADLQTADLVVFVALAKAITRADQVLSPDEIAHLETLEEQVGKARFDAAVAEAAKRFHGATEALEAAAEVSDPDVRKFLHGELLALAASDEVVAPEATVLSRLAELWLGADDAPTPLLLR